MVSPVTSKDLRVRELRGEVQALYGCLESEEAIIQRLYRQGKTQEAITREDMWLADLALYELTVDEMRELEGQR